MSAAPSTLAWDRWSSDHLDALEPVKRGSNEEDPSFPHFWKGPVLSWTQLLPDQHQSPLNITGNKLVVVKDEEHGLKETIYSVGGLTHKSRATGHSDPTDSEINLFKLELDCGTYTWERVIPTGGVIPQGRYGHSCTYYKGKIYVYGGRGQVRYNVFGAQGAIHCFNIKEGTWSELDTLVEDCDYPQARYGHACTVNGPMIYMHGGHVLYTHNRWGFTSEMISFNMDTNTWTVESPHYIKHPPPGQVNAVVGKPQNYLFLHRDFHIAVYFNRKIIIYGGRAPEFITNKSLCDVYEFNIDTKRWKMVEVTGYNPGQRNHHLAEKIGCFVMCYGGEMTHRWTDSFCCDTFVLDLRTYHCTKLAPLVSSVHGRCNVASCVLSDGDLVFYGGESIPAGSDQDILGSSAPNLIYHNDIFYMPLLPSLQSLCFNVIKTGGIDSSLLPPRLKQRLDEYV